jgi:AcrR family transcriptional regulator
MAVTGPVSRRERPAKPALSQESIVDAALALMAADGLDSVTMRRVAQALDTGPASLYVYVRNRDELVVLIIDRLAGEIRLPTPADGGDWRERLITLLTDAISLLGRYRGLAVAMFATVPTGPNALALTETLLGLLAESGMSRQAQAWAVDLLALYITAAGTERVINAERGPEPLREHEVYAGAAETFAGLPPDRYPHISGLHPELTLGEPEERTQWALNVLLNGILATATN